MIAVHAPVDKVRVHVPVRQQARFSVDRGMVERQYNAVKLNDMPTLWPYSHMREQAFYWAKRFIHDMALQGMDLHTAEADIKLYGPYRHRRFAGSIQEITTISRQRFEDQDQDVADFVLEAEFIAHRLRLVPHVVRSHASNAIS